MTSKMDIVIKAITVEVDGKEIELEVVGLNRGAIEYQPGLDPILVDASDRELKVVGHIARPDNDQTIVTIKCLRLVPIIGTEQQGKITNER